MTLCVVVPYRDRASHLEQFVPYMRQFLSGKDVEIVVVEQAAGKPFNRAKLLNVGFQHTGGRHATYAFHDVDMLPLEADYSDCSNPTHLASRAEQFGWKLPTPDYFGGVTLFDNRSFAKINGYANEYWGWGAEDDDILRRCQLHGVKTSRRDGKFRSLDHERNIDPEQYRKNVERLRRFARDLGDGLKTLEYKLVNAREEIIRDACYHHIVVEI